MGGQLDGIFLAGSLPHEFIILTVTLFICLWLINFFSLSLIAFGSRSRSESVDSFPQTGPFRGYQGFPEENTYRPIGRIVFVAFILRIGTSQAAGEWAWHAAWQRQHTRPAAATPIGSNSNSVPGSNR